MRKSAGRVQSRTLLCLACLLVCALTGSAPAADVVQIDFDDFTHVRDDRAALAAFNAGWGLLHEVEHAVRDSADPEGPGAAGECEEAINRMRRECGLAERAEYFYTP